MKLSVAAVALAMGMAFTAEAAPQAVPTAAPLQKRVFPTGNKDVSSFLATVEPDQLSSYFSDAAHGDADFTTHAESFTSVNAAAFSSYLSEKSIDPAQASAILGGIAGGAAAGGAAGAAGGNGSSSADGENGSSSASGEGASSSAGEGASSSAGEGASSSAASDANGASSSAASDANGASSSANGEANGSSSASGSESSGSGSGDGAMGLSINTAGAGLVAAAVAAFFGL